jgi:hypothetical protein
MKLAKFLFLGALLLPLNACVLTKIVTVPMRVSGAVISVVPAVGNTVDKAIDNAADQIDNIPL